MPAAHAMPTCCRISMRPLLIVTSSGGNSVLPIWVLSAIPEVRALIGELREQNCGQAACRYCQEQHHPEALLFARFQKPTFRPLPAAPDGTSLQRAIVVAGLERKSLLAVLPTGGGKSICYQLSWPLVVSCGTRQSKWLVVVEPGGHVGRLPLSLSTCPPGGV